MEFSSVTVLSRRLFVSARRSAGRWILLAIALFVARLVGAEEATNFVAKLAPIPPFLACQAAAKANDIPWQGIDQPSKTEVLLTGDSETTLITLHTKGRRSTQWLLYFEAGADTNGLPQKPHDLMVLYTSTGGKYEFTNLPATIRVRMIGPFIGPKSNPNDARSQPSLIDKSARLTVNITFLGLGLDQATAALYRLTTQEQQKKKDKIAFNFGIANQPFSSAEISHDRAAAALMHMTPAEERALAGGIPALYFYFNSVQDTPELDTILFKVLSLPSVWSLVKNVGLSPGITIGSPHERILPLALPGWNLPSPSLLYALSVEVTINKHPALALTMIVTDPHPPFLVCGGIVGFLAENPDDPENYLTLRVINAHSQ
jgi:hypothetical protein